MNPEIAACGLFCGTAANSAKEAVRGCRPNEKASWCKVRACCIEHGWQSCAECTLMPPQTCKKFDNFIAKVFQVVFRSDRRGCVERIREVGQEAFAAEMRLSGKLQPSGKEIVIKGFEVFLDKGRSRGILSMKPASETP